jgi:aromatic ring-opening dioxygenase LigB subunit
MIVFGAIAPHGDPAFVEGSATRLAMEELGRRLEQAAPEVTVVLTPHNVHVEGSFAVVVSATAAGTVEVSEDELSLPVDVERAAAVLGALRDAGLPAVGVSFGSNDPSLAVMPLDWGAAIPLWFLGGRAPAPRPIVLVSPARDLPLADHVRAGQALAAALDGTPAAIVASADHGHAHDPDGPFGYHPAAADYDARVVELVRENRLGDVVSLEPIVEDAQADSLWQLARVHGALGDAFEVELLSYECPTYFGMLCAAYRPSG